MVDDGDESIRAGAVEDDNEVDDVGGENEENGDEDKEDNVSSSIIFRTIFPDENYYNKRC